jgi:hypothetical protein
MIWGKLREKLEALRSLSGNNKKSLLSGWRKMKMMNMAVLARNP